MKSLGGEFASLAAALAIPAAVACIFPYRAAWFKASRGDVGGVAPAAAFVTLDEKEEAAMMRAAKTSWQSSREGAQSIRADLSFGELPQAREPAVLDVGSRTPQSGPAYVEWTAPPCLPLLAAPFPPPLTPEQAPPPGPAFPRDDMLSIDGFGLGAR